VVTFKGTPFETTVRLTCVRWHLAFPLRSRQREEMMQERGVTMHHSTIHRWVLTDTPGAGTGVPAAETPRGHELAP
jgi:putative transposase